MKWAYKFLQGIHPPAAKEVQSEFARWATIDKLTNPTKRHKIFKKLIRKSINAGLDHYDTFFKPLEKIGVYKNAAFIDPWENFDVEDTSDRLALQIEDSLSNRGRILISSAYRTGGATPTEKIAIEQGFEKAKGIVRGTMQGLYITSFLLRLKAREVENVRRVEVDDSKMCPICRKLRKSEYSVDYLLAQDNPIIFNSHPNCRGTYIPIINDIAQYSQGLVDSNEASRVNFKAGAGIITNCPIELRPIIHQLGRRFPLPTINFGAKRTGFSAGALDITDDRLRDEDVRYVIGEELGGEAYKIVKSIFDKQYPAMVNLGLVRPPKETTNNEELFRLLYIDYINNALDDTYEVLWFKKYMDGTKFGRHN